MPKLIVEIVLALALTTGAVVSFAAGALADVAVRDAYARASATPAATSATLYLTIAGNGEADRLIAVASPGLTAMLHRSEAIDGVSTMRHLDSLEIPAEGEVVLKPGGSHVMLMGLKAPLRTGDRVQLQLRFEKAGTVEVTVPVGSVAQDGPVPGG